MAKRTQSQAAQDRWDRMTVEEKAEQKEKMEAGRKTAAKIREVNGKKPTKRRRRAKVSKPAPLEVGFMDLVERTRDLLVLTGGREKLDPLIQLAEHTVQVEETIARQG